jgi:hypothetical protein
MTNPLRGYGKVKGKTEYGICMVMTSFHVICSSNFVQRLAILTEQFHNCPQTPGKHQQTTINWTTTSFIYTLHSNSLFTNQLITSCHTQTYQLKALLKKKNKNKQDLNSPQEVISRKYTELRKKRKHVHQTSNIHFQICLEAQYCLLLNLRYLFSKFTAMYILVICNRI